MDNITNTMTAERMSQTPSYFGMPACGHALVSSQWTVDAVIIGSAKGDMGFAPAARTRMGSHAWGPPTS